MISNSKIALQKYYTSKLDLETQWEKLYHRVKALPSLARLSELTSASTLFRILWGFDLAEVPAAIFYLLEIEKDRDREREMF